MTVLSQPFDHVAVGDTFLTPGRTISETDVLSFASLTRDAHPLHTDAEWAAASRFGQRTAHGLLIVSYAAGLVPLDPEYAVALRRVKQAVFKRPVHIDDTIRVTGEIVSKRPLDDRHGLIECRWTILNQRDEVVARASVEIIWARAPAGDERPAVSLVGAPVRLAR